MKKLLIIVVCLFVMCSSVMASHYIDGDSISKNIYDDARLSLKDSDHLIFIGRGGKRVEETINTLNSGLFQPGDKITLITGTASMLIGDTADHVLYQLDYFLPQFLGDNPGVTVILSELPPVILPSLKHKIERFNKKIGNLATKYKLKLNDYEISHEDVSDDKIHLEPGAYNGRHFKE